VIALAAVGATVVVAIFALIGFVLWRKRAQARTSGKEASPTTFSTLPLEKETFPAPQSSHPGYTRMPSEPLLSSERSGGVGYGKVPETLEAASATLAGGYTAAPPLKLEYDVVPSSEYDVAPTLSTIRI
jgi:hypothetical protein